MVFQRLATRGRSVFILMLVLIGLQWASGPAKAFAQSSHPMRVFSPWTEGIPWNGNWGAFNRVRNKDSSEFTGYTCVLDDKARGELKNLIDTLRADHEHIYNRTDIKVPQKERGRIYSEIYRSRIQDGSAGQYAEQYNLPGKITVDNLAGRSDELPKPEKVKRFTHFFYELSVNPLLAGCLTNGSVLSEFANVFKQNVFHFIKYLPAFFMGLLNLPILAIGLGLYHLFAPIGFGISLTTPHSERGDTIFDAIGGFQGIWSAFSGGSIQASDSDLSCASGGGKLAGINCANLQPANQVKSPWIRISLGLRDALSAVYGIIVIAVALIYMFRRNPGSAYDVKVVLPRVAIAVILSVSAPYWIGTLISFSNWTVQGMLSANMALAGTSETGGSGSIAAQITNILVRFFLEDENIFSGGLGGFIGSMLIYPAIAFVLLGFGLAFAGLVLLAIVRQVALILLIIFTPIACLALTLRKWQKYFSFWLRGLLVVCLLPVVQAFCLVIGVSLAQGFFANDANNLGGAVSRMMAIVVLLVTMFGMFKIAVSMKAYVTGGPADFFESAGSKLGMAGTVAKRINPGVGAALETAGAVASRMGRVSADFAPETRGGSLLARPYSRPRRMGLLDAFREVKREQKQEQAMDALLGRSRLPQSGRTAPGSPKGAVEGQTAAGVALPRGSTSLTAPSTTSTGTASTSYASPYAFVPTAHADAAPVELPAPPRSSGEGDSPPVGTLGRVKQRVRAHMEKTPAVRMSRWTADRLRQAKAKRELGLSGPREANLSTRAKVAGARVATNGSVAVKGRLGSAGEFAGKAKGKGGAAKAAKTSTKTAKASVKVLSSLRRPPFKR